MLNILFYIRKDRKDKNNNSPIYCRITYNGIRTDFSIKRFIPEDRPLAFIFWPEMSLYCLCFNTSIS